MEVSVVIVTYNSASSIAKCLESVLKQRGVQFEVIVVDNASSDTTVSVVKKFPVKLVESQKNLGFGCGCNLGFSYSSGGLIYTFNPDASLEADDGLEKICRAFQKNMAWGMAGTTVVNADSSHESMPAFNYPGQVEEYADLAKLPGDIAWVIGASMIIRRTIYEKLSGFDPAFFLYSEETDFCLRLRKLGYEIGYIKSVVVRHIGGVSADRSDPYPTAAGKTKGMILFRLKHYSKAHCVCLARKDLRYARFRSILNGLLAVIQPKYSKAWRKKRRYQAIMNVSREFLRDSEMPEATKPTEKCSQ